jgi:hypothetical protein
MDTYELLYFHCISIQNTPIFAQQATVILLHMPVVVDNHGLFD